MYRTPPHQQHHHAQNPPPTAYSAGPTHYVAPDGSVRRVARPSHRGPSDPDLAQQQVRHDNDATQFSAPSGSAYAPADPFISASVSQPFYPYNTTPAGYPAYYPDPLHSAQRYASGHPSGGHTYIYTRQGQQVPPPFFYPPGPIPMHFPDLTVAQYPSPYHYSQYHIPPQFFPQASSQVPASAPASQPASAPAAAPASAPPNPPPPPVPSNNRTASPPDPPPRATNPIPTVIRCNTPRLVLNNPPIIQVDPSSLRMETSPNFSSSAAGHIAKLVGRKNWIPWHRQTVQLLYQYMVWNLVCDEPSPDELLAGTVPPQRRPVYPPLLPANYTDAELAAYNAWSKKDSTAQQILTAALSPSLHLMLPSVEDTPDLNARTLYRYLREHYGMGDAITAYNTRESIRSFQCLAGLDATVKFVEKWKITVTALAASGYPIVWTDILINFSKNLYQHYVFSVLRQEVVTKCSKEPHLVDQDYFNDLCTRVLATAEHHYTGKSSNSSSSPTPRSQNFTPRASQPDSAANGQSAQNSQETRTREQDRRDQPKPQAPRNGGGRAYVAENLDIDEVDPDEDVPNIDEPVAALASNDDLIFAYSSFVAAVETSDTDTKYLDVIDTPEVQEIAARCSCLADSGCSIHIFRDRSVFWTYDDDDTVKIKTANCGILKTVGRGEVRLRVRAVDGRYIILILPDCVCAPDAPINLLSVGALTERGMALLFGQRFTRFYFPRSHEKLARVVFAARVVRRLTFLHAAALSPPSDTKESLDMDLAFAGMPQPFVKPKEDWYTWHCRFYHPGKQTTTEMLTGTYATGIKWDGVIVNSECPSCIMGRFPAFPYEHNAKRAENPGDLIHLDTCGPFPVLSPRKEQYFIALLDDKTNWGEATPVRYKSQVFPVYLDFEAAFELEMDCKIKALRSDGAKEFTLGDLGAHLRAKGIQHQVTVPYAHQQNGKIERFIQTIEAHAQTLLVHAGLPASFWADAVSTAAYLFVRLPSSTLPKNTTAYELRKGRKPDLSNLRVWGCQAYVLYKKEERKKGGPKGYEAIFVGYPENSVGWIVRDLKGAYHTVNHVIFNESSPGKLSSKSSFMDVPFQTPDTNGDLPIALRKPKRTLKNDISPTGLAALQVGYQSTLDLIQQTRFLHTGLPLPPPSIIADFSALFCFEEILPTQDDSFARLEEEYVTSYPTAFISYPTSRTRSWDLSKPPASYHEALARPDSDSWMQAMKEEVQAMETNKVFEETELPDGRHTIGMKWVYDYKRHLETNEIERYKARLVAHGHRQGPDDYTNSYAPVAKLTSIRACIAYAAKYDFELYTFDIKTAFLNATLSDVIYMKQIPGFPLQNPSTVLRCLRAIYGLKQAGYEWFHELASTLREIGLHPSPVDNAVFHASWTVPPDPSITIPPDQNRVFVTIPVHVDDGLVLTNSPALYAWIIARIRLKYAVKDLGPAIRYLGITIHRDRKNRKIYLSQQHFIIDLLTSYNMLTCTPSPVPLRIRLHLLPDPPPNALPDVSDDKLTGYYQALVGSILYLALTTRPDIAFAAMSLGQYNSAPTRAHFLAAKGVLRYLSGTRGYALEYGSEYIKERVGPDALPRGNAAFSDADWATDEKDRKSVSGYAIFFHDALISWSAVKQRTTALSSTESEYMAMTHMMKESIWLRLFANAYEMPLTKPFPIFADNQGSLDTASKPSNTARMKHIDIRYHFIREHLSTGAFRTSWISTSDMTADIFTKALEPLLHKKHCTYLGLVDRSSSEDGGVLAL